MQLLISLIGLLSAAITLWAAYVNRDQPLLPKFSKSETNPQSSGEGDSTKVDHDVPFSETIFGVASPAIAIVLWCFTIGFLCMTNPDWLSRYEASLGDPILRVIGFGAHTFNHMNQNSSMGDFDSGLAGHVSLYMFLFSGAGFGASIASLVHEKICKLHAVAFLAFVLIAHGFATAYGLVIAKAIAT